LSIYTTWNGIPIKPHQTSDCHSTSFFATLKTIIFYWGWILSRQHSRGATILLKQQQQQQQQQQKQQQQQQQQQQQ